jgi:hypothetical protein
LADSARGLSPNGLRKILQAGTALQSDLKYVWERTALPKDILADLLYHVDFKYLKSFCKKQNSEALHEIFREKGSVNFSKICESMREIFSSEKVWEAINQANTKVLKKIIRNQALTDAQVDALVDKGPGNIVEFYWQRHRLPRQTIVKILRMPLKKRVDRGFELFAANVSKEFGSLDYGVCADLLAIDDPQLEDFFVSYVQNEHALKMLACSLGVSSVRKASYRQADNEKTVSAIYEVVLPRQVYMKLEHHTVLKSMYKHMMLCAVGLANVLNEVNEVQIEFIPFPIDWLDEQAES